MIKMYVTYETKKMQQGLNDCNYNPVKQGLVEMNMDSNIVKAITPHTYCLHNHYCIFNKNRTQLERDILTLEKELHDFEYIKSEFINGNVIYHPDLDEYYNINLLSYTGTDSKKHCKTDVTVHDNFINAVNTRITNLKYDIKNLYNFRLNVIHGKVGGYGHGD